MSAVLWKVFAHVEGFSKLGPQCKLFIVLPFSHIKRMESTSYIHISVHEGCLINHLCGVRLFNLCKSRPTSTLVSVKGSLLDREHMHSFINLIFFVVF